jgi:hypothetical protein
MNRRITQMRSLGDDPVSAAASAAAAAAASAASAGPSTAPRPSSRTKHHRHVRVPASPFPPAADVAASAAAPSVSASGVQDKKRGGTRRRHGRPSPSAATSSVATEKEGLPSVVHAAHQGHLLLLGGTVLGIGLIALLLRRHDEPAAPEHEPVRPA